ncbi:MAG: hypothetical protein ACO3YP_04620 [bacterium]
MSAASPVASTEVAWTTNLLKITHKTVHLGSLFHYNGQPERQHGIGTNSLDHQARWRQA